MDIQDAIRIVFVGAGATLILDAWLVVLKRFGIKGLDLAHVGRWLGHVFQGRFVQPSISKAAPIRGEVVLGWVTHYAIGVGFAALLFALTGGEWFRSPSLLPAVLVGACTVVAPLFVMQPAMGAGFAASKTPTPVANCVRSLVNHIVFGLGLYVSATVTNLL